ncbi:MAG: hypothetical protein EBR10_08685 [Planctomycetes bacterium]|nr:hypothetical protein [Planctomycetota bacterium]
MPSGTPRFIFATDSRVVAPQVFLLRETADALGAYSTAWTDLSTQGEQEVFMQRAFIGFSWVLSLASAFHAAAEPPLVTFVKNNSWDGGYNGSIIITNRAATAMQDWRAEWDNGPTVASAWNGTYSFSSGHATLINAGWNGTIAPGASATVGYSGVGTLLENVSQCSVNGVAAEVAYQGPFNCISDLDEDGATGGSDLAVMLGSWGQAGGAAASDFDGSGSIDGADLSVLLSNWGACPPERRIVAYWIEWGIYGRNYQPSDTPLHKITHLNYAFAKIDSQGRVAPFDTYAAIEKNYPGDTWDQPIRGTYHQLNTVLRKQYPHIKTLISVGGWTLSGAFSDAALTASSRAVFAQSCVDFIRAYGFDGIDIDWEYPVAGGLPSNTYRPEDKQNFTLLLRDTRAALNAAGAEDGVHYLLTIAAPAGYDKFENLEASQIHQHLDFINIMTYDYFGAWELAYTANHAAFEPDLGLPSSNEQLRTKYNTRHAVEQYLTAGTPPEKVVLGLPFYGRAWRGVPATGFGLHQPGTGVPPGTWDDWSSGATGVNDFTEIDRTLLASGSGYQRHWDPVTKNPFLYSATAHGGHWIGYDDEQSIALKLEWANEIGLSGAMFWEVTADRDQKLLDVIGQSLGARPVSP